MSALCASSSDVLALLRSARPVKMSRSLRSARMSVRCRVPPHLLCLVIFASLDSSCVWEPAATTLCFI